MPTSWFYRERKSKAQVAAAKAVADFVKKERLRAKGRFTELKAHFDRDYSDAAERLRHLICDPNPAMLAQVEEFRKAVRWIIAKQLYDKQFAGDVLVGERELDGRIVATDTGDVTFKNMNQQ